jgi:hypothetical protein
MTSDNARLTETIDEEFSDGPAPEVLDPGSVIAGRYEIRGVLGSGGYAVVYPSRLPMPHAPRGRSRRRMRRQTSSRAAASRWCASE